MNQRAIAVMIIAILVISGIGIAAFPGAGDDDPSAGETGIDAKGRKVAIPADLDNGIVLGSAGPLRYLSIFDMYDSAVQVDRGNVTDLKNGRAHSCACPYDEFGPDMCHPDNALEAATMERIGQRNPGPIIVKGSVHDSYRANCDPLAQGLTLVVIRAQIQVEIWKATSPLPIGMWTTSK